MTVREVTRVGVVEAGVKPGPATLMVKDPYFAVAVWGRFHPSCFFFLVLNLSCPAVYWGISIETQKSLKQHFCTVAGSGIFFVTKETVR